MNEAVPIRSRDDFLWFVVLCLMRRHQRGVAEVMSHHDGGIQGRKIECRHWICVVATCGLYDDGALVLLA